ncbi:hypothetical protein NE237_011125 [Protea cynaroides]|uniref:Uncharacterized protein n=1 Tax=Protea cynaroides TaxID=273540 RepID=A0A9Q0GYI6_9MAGN|nr:hypothetical protein NE237_011125 [Protea cynaroides]
MFNQFLETLSEAYVSVEYFVVLNFDIMISADGACYLPSPFFLGLGHWNMNLCVSGRVTEGQGATFSDFTVWHDSEELYDLDQVLDLWLLVFIKAGFYVPHLWVIG